MSFNRLKYDNCELKAYNKETLGPGNYLYNTPLICDNCFNDNPRIINQKIGVSLDKSVGWRFYAGPVDVESELLNLNRPGTKCADKKYKPDCASTDCANQGHPCGAGVSETCTNAENSLRNPWNRPGDNNLYDFPKCKFQTEDTRLSNPSNNLRGTGWNRFVPLCKDPQEQVTFPGEYMISTRIVVKDNHRPCVYAPGINNMHPVEKKGKECSQTMSVEANPTKALYQYNTCN